LVIFCVIGAPDFFTGAAFLAAFFRAGAFFAAFFGAFLAAFLVAMLFSTFPKNLSGTRASPNQALPTLSKTSLHQAAGECIKHETLQYKCFLRLRQKYPVFSGPRARTQLAQKIRTDYPYAEKNSWSHCLHGSQAKPVRSSCSHVN
jgi:hypothetical protein